jgi:RNA polymerase sigma-70 factor (ECF subfamily)
VLSSSALSGARADLGAADPLSQMAGTPFPLGAARETRFREVVERHFAFVWRSVRRLGVRPGDVDDAAQEVFLVAARRLDDFTPERERAFLFGTAIRVVSTRRRSARRRPEELDADSDARTTEGPSPEELAELAQARPLLQEILDGMNDELRAVFVLSELEELAVREIAVVLGVPQGTVSSRLRTARERFHAEVKRLNARSAFAWRKR